MWNDGLVGCNTGLYVCADGTGDVISEANESFDWRFDAESRVLTITTTRQRDGVEQDSVLTYSPADDTLSGTRRDSTESPWVSRRELRAAAEKSERIR
jgi:hypothetical protein